MNTEDVLQGMPREKLMRIVSKAEKKFGLGAEEMPDKYASSEDIIMVIEDLGRYRGLSYDAASDELVLANEEELDEEWRQYARDLEG